MEKIKGFEVVEKFLDNWKASSKVWMLDQYQKFLEDKKNREENPSEARRLYKMPYGEDRSAKVYALLDSLYERVEENGLAYWIIPRMNYYTGKVNMEKTCEYNALTVTLNEEYSKFKNKWSLVYKILDRTGGKYKTYEDVVEYDLQKEYECKYTKLVADCQKITGDIQKADLRIGATDNIEGYIIGSKGEAEIWSTLSGGEVQCLHFRFYCHKRK